MPNPIDSYGREILSEPIPAGGTRYFDRERTCCVGLQVDDVAQALALFNACPPPAFQTVASTMADPQRVDEILTAMESMWPAQKLKLDKILNGVK